MLSGRVWLAANQADNLRRLIQNRLSIQVIQVPVRRATIETPILCVRFGAGTGNWRRRRQSVAKEHSTRTRFRMLLTAEDTARQGFQTFGETGVVLEKLLVLQVHFFKRRGCSLVGMGEVL